MNDEVKNTIDDARKKSPSSYKERGSFVSLLTLLDTLMRLAIRKTLLQFLKPLYSFDKERAHVFVCLRLDPRYKTLFELLPLQLADEYEREEEKNLSQELFKLSEAKRKSKEKKERAEAEKAKKKAEEEKKKAEKEKKNAQKEKKKAEKEKKNAEKKAEREKKKEKKKKGYKRKGEGEKGEHKRNEKRRKKRSLRKSLQRILLSWQQLVLTMRRVQSAQIMTPLKIRRTIIQSKVRWMIVERKWLI